MTNLVSQARTISVPGDFSTITHALESSFPDDTVLVNRDTYQELIRFPPHRVYLLSRYALTGDSVDIYETIIDGSSHANLDTACVVLFSNGCADGSTLSGFTITGGAGIRPEGMEFRFAGGFEVNGCSPIISNNIFTRNSSSWSPIGHFISSSAQFLYNKSEDLEFISTGLHVAYNIGLSPVLIEGNEFLDNPRSATAVTPGIVVNSDAAAIIRSNRFYGLHGSTVTCIDYFGDNAIIEGNIFENLRATGEWSAIIEIAEGHCQLRDNSFANVEVDNFAAVLFGSGRNLFTLAIEGNIFENVRGTGLSGSGYAVGCLWIQDFAANIQENIFRNCEGTIGGAIAIGTGTRTIEIMSNVFEACSATTSNEVPSGAIYRYYREPIHAWWNIFRRNSPGAVGTYNLAFDSSADFRENYWGDATGPFDLQRNPDGLGDAVSADIVIDPWLTDSLIDAVDEPPAWIPRKTELISYPNPFNSTARLSLSVEKPGTYSVKLYSITGQLMRELWRGGVVISREITVDARDLSSGVYFATADDVETHLRTATVKMVLVK